MVDLAPPRPAQTVRRAMTRAEAWGVAVFGGWAVVGLHLDGWAHRSDKQESFFTPWHAVLYSGVAAAVVYFVTLGQRQTRQGITGSADGERLSIVGMVIFAFGAVGDFAWHSLFGIEEDIEALISPSHLTLMIGGTFALTGALRGAARYFAGRERPTLGGALPVILATSWAASVVAFFLMFTSPFVFEHFGRPWRPDDQTAEVLVGFGAAAVILFSALLFGALGFVARRFTPPFGTATLMLGSLALLQVGLEGFDRWTHVLAALAGGVVVDVVARRDGWRRPELAFAAGAVVLWPLFFASVAATGAGLGWSMELWTGTSVLATLAAAGVGVLSRPAPDAAFVGVPAAA